MDNLSLKSNGMLAGYPKCVAEIEENKGRVF